MTSPEAVMLHRFATGYDPLLALVAGLPEPAIVHRPHPDRWSVHCILIHLSDSEVQFHVRLRSILADEDSLLPAHDEHAWSVEADYDSACRQSALMLIKTLREVNADLLRRLPETSWARTGTHTRRGRMSISRLVEEAVSHVDQHLDQARRVLAAYAGHRATG